MSSAYSTLSFSVSFVVVVLVFVVVVFVVVVVVVFLLLFFFLGGGVTLPTFFSKFSISVSSVLFLNVDFCVLFCTVSIDFVRISFIFSIVGSSSLKASNLVFTSIMKGVADFFLTLRGVALPLEFLLSL